MAEEKSRRQVIHLECTEQRIGRTGHGRYPPRRTKIQPVALSPEVQPVFASIHASS